MPGAKRPAERADHDHTRGVINPDCIKFGLQFGQHGAAERIELFGAIERERDDAAGNRVQNQGFHCFRGHAQSVWAFEHDRALFRDYYHLLKSRPRQLTKPGDCARVEQTTMEARRKPSSKPFDWARSPYTQE